MGADFPLLSNEILLPNLVFFRSLLGHVSSATTEAHYEKTVPEAVLKGMRLLEDATAKR
jgi:hypothetical protein